MLFVLYFLLLYQVADNSVFVTTSISKVSDKFKPKQSKIFANLNENRKLLVNNTQYLQHYKIMHIYLKLIL